MMKETPIINGMPSCLISGTLNPLEKFATPLII